MKKILFCCFALLTSFPLIAQSLDSVLRRYGNDFQQEKVYLHYDKSVYYPGETIWFKAYVLEGMVPASVSKTLYVDYVADDGGVLAHQVCPLVEGITNNQFDIPAAYTGNFIHIRAYSKWMLNFDTAFLYEKDLPIVHKTTVSRAVKATIIPGVRFFPEGGDLVAGVLNHVAFKATDQFGRPVQIKGWVTDDKGTHIDSLRVVHDGMGVFRITPAENLAYTAKWKDEKGIEHTSALPTIKKEGVSMHIDVSESKRIITITAPEKVTAQLGKLHLVGTLSQSTAFINDISISGSSTVKRIIPTENLPSGILTITLFDADWNAMAERITFINNHEFSFETVMEVKRWGLSKRKRNEIEVAVPVNFQGASLSVSVTDAAIEKDTATNIISHFLLTSELKGNIHKPAYYFKGKSDSLDQHLDLVMLTNGWRRFKWEDVTKGRYPVINYPKDTTYLNLSGKVFGVSKSQLSGKESIVLLVKDMDSTTKMLMLPINKDGTFSDPGIILFDTVQVYYSLKSKLLAQAEARFMTDRLPAPNYTAFSKNFTNRFQQMDTTGSWYHAAVAAQANRLEDLRKGKIMEAVLIKTTKKAPVEILDDKYASGMFKGGDGYSFDLVNDAASSGYFNIFNYLQGKVAGLTINRTGNSVSLSWRGGTPAVYLDEMQTDIDLISNIPVNDVAFIKVFRPPFMGGFGGSSGAIAIYTRKGDDTKSISKGLTKNRITGYSPIKEFYAPNYDTFSQRNEEADLRTTLYWNPGINLMPKQQKVTFIFYNNDLAKSFRIVIEGMSKDGLLTHMEQLME